MKHNKQKVSKIVDELMTFCFSVGATDISINIKENAEGFKIFLKSNFAKSCRAKATELCKLLKCSKREEMEEYYWYLAGDSDVETELSLVGMMIDDCKIDFIKDDNIEITLFRKKSKSLST